MFLLAKFSLLHFEKVQITFKEKMVDTGNGHQPLTGNSLSRRIPDKNAIVHA